MKFYHTRRGFTIPELVVAMTILAILSTVGFISYLGYTSQSRDTVRTADLKSITTVLQLHKSKTLKYPSPSDSTNITYSGAVVWTQGGFGEESAQETGKIFGELKDPKYGNDYTYSVTENKKEYQLAALFENGGAIGSDLFTYSGENLFSIPQSYAASPFSPLELSPIIWLDAMDIDGDGATNDNPSNGGNIPIWVNKSTVGVTNNPSITNGSLDYSTNGFDSSYPGVFIDKNSGLLLNNSNITQGDIFYVVQRNDPFGGTDSNGIGLQSSVNSNYYIGYYDSYRNALRIGNSPNHQSSSPATTSGGTWPFIYGFHTTGTNYVFEDTGNIISQGATNSISGQVWAFNKAGAVSNKTADYVVSEILIFNTALTLLERQKVEGYLAHKWGQAYYLPSSHPYKNNPPESSGPPPAPDTTPDAFIFNDVTDANVSTEYTSNTIIVSGINTVTTIAISNGEYSKNNGAYTSNTGTVNEGDTISVRLTSSANNSTLVSAQLSIGGVSENFQVTTFIADTTPDDFQFNGVIDAETNRMYYSNTITVSGLNVSVPISITGSGALYKIGTGVPSDVTGLGSASASSSYSGNNPEYAFDNNTSNLGWGNNGTVPAQLRYDFGAGKEKIISTYTLYRDSGQDGGWSNDNYSPKNWTFEGSNDNSIWTILDTQTNQRIRKDKTKTEYDFNNSQYFRYYRINISSARNSNWTNITEMELISENPGSYVATTGTVSNGSIITVKMPASANAGTLKTAAITIGSLTKNFNITTDAPDTIPDDFSFTSVSNASLNTSYTSNTITVSGINTSTAISLSGGGEYNINGGAYTSAAGTVQEDDIVNIRRTSSSSNSVTVSSTLNIGGVTAVYNITTPAPPPDTTPDAFTFVDEIGANLSTLYTSNIITVSGINTASSLSISGGTYSKNGAGYTSSSTTVNNGDTISLRVTSSASNSTATNVDLTIGGVTDRYTVTTLAADTTPDAFSFTNITNAALNQEYESNLITITGINTATSVSVSGASGVMYQINAGTWRSTGGTVQQGDTVRLRNTSSPSGSTTLTHTLTVGGVSSNFSITTLSPDTTPDTFVFQNITDATLSSQYISNDISVTGINTPVNISIVGGEYRIGTSGTFTSTSGTISNNQVLTVRLVSSSAANTNQSAIVTVGGITVSYDVRTMSFSTVSDDIESGPASNIYVTGDYNGILAHAKNGDTHYVIATPSILAYDLANTDIMSIIADKKLVYDGFENIPETYSNAGLTMSGGFDFLITSPLLYEGNKEDLGSYGGLKQIDEGIKSTYNNFPAYSKIASYMDDYSLGYLEYIIGNIIGINPIKPFYCSDILQSKLIYNIATQATVTASPSGFGSVGVEGLNNGITSTEGALDYEYHSLDGNASIFFEWDTPQKVGYLKIYNRTGCCSSRLSGANIKLFDSDGGILYSHTLWDTSEDYVIDLDLEGIGQLHNVKKLSIQTVAGNYLNVREVEIFLGGNVLDGEYKVDKDGLGGQSPYKVYCDMTTDGGGWTRIGQNYVNNGEFSGQNHIAEHNFKLYNNSSDNLIVAHSTMTPPSSIPDAFALQHNGSSSESYQLYFSDIPGEYFAQEIRLYGWVRGTTASVFNNTVAYATSQSETTPEYDVLETDGSWEYRMARIPLTGLVKDFTWDAGKGTSGPFYMTGLKMEVYYR